MLRVWLVALLLLTFAACSQVVTPTPAVISQQPTFPAVVTFTPSPIPSPTATPPPSTTPDRVATALARPTRTPRPTFTPTSTPTPTPTYPVVVWHPAVADQLITLPANEMAWSPLSNQLVYSDCPHHLPEKDHTQPAPAGGLFLAQAPHFTPQEITPAGFTCPSYFQFFLDPVWQPNGQSILYSQPYPPDNPSYESPGLYQLLLADQTVVDLKMSGWWQRVNGWLTPTQIIVSHYLGAGNLSVRLFELQHQQLVAETDLRGDRVRSINSPWGASGYSFYTDSDYVGQFVGAFSNHSFNVDDVGKKGFHNPFIRYLHFQHPETPGLLHSAFVDWLFGTPQMLVLTTSNPNGFPMNGSGLPAVAIPTELQLWNVETDELTPLIPNGVWGNFSPDQTYLTFIQHQENQYSWQLLNRVTGENHLIHTMPLTEIKLLSFSPSGRYIAFAYQLSSMNSSVLIYDVAEQNMVASLTGLSNLPIWSPAGDNLVYQQDEDWSLLYVPHNTTQRLTMKNSLHVRNPQWSFDGSYLAFDVGAEMVIWPIPITPPH